MKSIKVMAVCFLGFLILMGGMPTGADADDLLLIVPAITALKKPRAPENINGLPSPITTANSLWWDDKSTNESGFIVERMDGIPISGIPDNYSRIGQTDRNVTTFWDASITPGKPYTYRVQAYNRRYNSGYAPINNTKTLTCTTPRPPEAPANLSAVAASTTSITLKWDFTGNNAESWYIERSNNCTGVFSQVGTLGGATQRSYVDTYNLGPGQSYCYRVRAGNYNANHPDPQKRFQFSDYSNVARATPQDTTGAPVLTGPSSVTREYVIIWSFTWPTPGNPNDHYVLGQNHTSPDGPFTEIGTSENGDRTTPFTLQMQPDATDIGTTTYFRVGAWVNNNQWKYSNVIAVQTPKISISLYPTCDNLMELSSINTAYQITPFPDGKLRVGTDFFRVDNSYIDPFGYLIPFWTDTYTRDSSALWFGDWFGTELSTFIQGRTIFSAKLSLTPANVGLVREIGLLLFSQHWETLTLTFDNCPMVSASPMKQVWAPTAPNVPWQIDVTDMVQAWATGGKPNYGFLLRDNHNNGNPVQEIGNFFYGFDIYSKETAPLESYKPRLDLEIR